MERRRLVDEMKGENLAEDGGRRQYEESAQSKPFSYQLGTRSHQLGVYSARGEKRTAVNRRPLTLGTPVNYVAKGRGTSLLICLAVLNMKFCFLLFSVLEGQLHAFSRLDSRIEQRVI